MILVLWSVDAFSNDLEETEIYLCKPKKLLQSALKAKKLSKQLSTVLSIEIALMEIFNNDLFRRKT